MSKSKKHIATTVMVRFLYLFLVSSIILVSFQVYHEGLMPHNILEEKCKSCFKSDSLVKPNDYPWSANKPCSLGDYSVEGVIPVMFDSLLALDLNHRLTNGYNPSESKSNYHGTDVVIDSVKCSAAIDISVRCLNEDQIKELLDELSFKGFAGWYRKKGEDGWNGDNHVHAIWVSSPMKQQLAYQVEKWLENKNGLVSDQEYKFWQPKDSIVQKISKVFREYNPR